MNFLDLEITTFLNRFAQRSWVFDEAVGFLSNNHLLKGGVLAAVFWWAWFRGDDDEPRARASLATTMIGSGVAMVFARVLSFSLPFRLRPIHEGSLGFRPPLGMNPDILDGWSSFPSDHAVLFFALSTGLLLVSRRAGVFALLYTTLFIAFPRLYLGLHYATDILAGALLGVTIVLAGSRWPGRTRRMETVAGWSRTRPALFYPVFFLLTFQLADTFDSSRAVAKAIAKLLASVFS